MKYFVTGATGFVGGRVARLLAQDGHQVVALVRNPDQAKDLAGLGILLDTGDVTDKESMRAPMTGVDGVFHIAAWYKIGMRDKSDGVRVNVQGTRNMLELMRELSVPKGVYTSTLGVHEDTGGRLVDETYRYDGPYYSEYTRTKAEAHRLADEFIAGGLPLVIAIAGLMYGPGDHSSVRDTLIQYLQRRLPMLPQRTAFCWAHVDDAARAHILAMEKGRRGETYIIAGPKHTLVEALHVAREITGIPEPRAVPAGLFKALSVVMGVVERVVALPEVFTREALRSLAGVTYIGDNAKARRELGYNPRPLRVGLAETLQHEMRSLGMRPLPATPKPPA
jgi:nucleoside-diphosphate-sugar epimerase